MVEGQNRKEELQWLHTRELLTMIHNTSMGAKRRIKPTDIIKLSMDKVEVASKEGEEEFMRMLMAGAGVKVDSTGVGVDSAGGNMDSTGEMPKPQNN